ncbi:terpene synthase family protein [Daldinia caldariorum]|uniref:terpene synthase family protein n=1 Tax=Daldinia caldariorum TaxID=326644 RepID=UPI002007209B|nr:terpene synthase family protein [Daldinia caldariorum]KAI1470985.1 terpene synthase family protein [Daldinia caldariorum]
MALIEDLNSHGKSLIQRAWRGYDAEFGFGSFSGAIYDTAWVSMIAKQTDTKNWLFPECFHYLLDTQSEEGSWDSGSSQIDSILNTAASLLALKRHFRQPLQVIAVPQVDLKKRIDNATTALRSRLTSWDVGSSSHVGFEILVPAILGYLEDEGLFFHFPGRDELLDLNKAKLAMLTPKVLYSKAKTTLIHSLEAFIGKIDFDQISHHKTGGSMMASPSSSAAYLMSATRWDIETQNYLSHVVGRYGNGSVPSAFPSTYFEFSWILSTLLRGGFTSSDLACPELNMVANVLVGAFHRMDGVIGFAPCVGTDVDDTASGIFSLSMLQLDQNNGIERMIEVFEVDAHFQTYPSERNPSFTANCNALMALLHHKDVARYSSQILKTVQFLCDYWWSADNGIQDKWNLCRLYPCLLLVQTFSDLFALLDDQKLCNLFSQQTKSRMSIVTFQACYRTILEQDSNGSWNKSPEQSAYGVLILSKARMLSFLQPIRQNIDDAVNAGVDFLSSLDLLSLVPDYIWTEKVTYASVFLTSSYVLAALKSATSTSASAQVGLCFNGAGSCDSSNSDYIKLFLHTPMFRDVAEWHIQASYLESTLFRPLLRERRLDIFPRENMNEDKYFDIIPFTWTACNNRSGALASASLLCEMMIISFLNYQADEFMEAVAAPSFANNPKGLREIIEALFSPKTANVIGLNLNYEAVRPLSQFITYLLNHPQVTSSSTWDRKCLKRELRMFLLAHVKQEEDSALFALQTQTETFDDVDASFFSWVRTTSADHTSCPYSFTFLSCLLSSGVSSGDESFPSTKLKYFAEAACRHLASMCRMHNDYGSISRDITERNLNAINFPEFESLGSEDSLDRIGTSQREANGTLKVKKKVLFELAEYERCCLNEAFRQLQEEFECPRRGVTARRIGRRHVSIRRMFCDVTDLYGQIYYIRDIASRMKPSVSNETSGVRIR